jgi:hypothetical protein
MTRGQRRAPDADRYREWQGGYRCYDLVKEASIALGVVLALCVVLTIAFSSPDEKPSTIQSWSRTDPVDFLTTATTELDGSSGTGGYGPPYNHASCGQHIAFIYPQKWLGVSHPVNTAQDFVLAPLRSITGQPALLATVTTYESAPAKQQTAWTSAYENGLSKASANANGSITVPGSGYGPLPTMMGGLLSFAQGGGLDGALLTSRMMEIPLGQEPTGVRHRPPARDREYAIAYARYVVKVPDGLVPVRRRAAHCAAWPRYKPPIARLNELNNLLGSYN